MTWFFFFFFAAGVGFVDAYNEDMEPGVPDNLYIRYDPVLVNERRK